MRLKKAFFYNRAPFDNFYIDFGKDNLVLLSGINGSGKTTIISYLVDSFFELAKKNYSVEFEDKINKFYRISSDMYAINPSVDSFVYFRFIDINGNEIDYVDYRSKHFNSSLYESVINLDNKIPASEINMILNDDRLVCKKWSIADKKRIHNIFSQNMLTYFPAYRYEAPSFLNDPYQFKLNFNTQMNYVGYLDNPIEVTSDLPNIANWIMDVVLDNLNYKIDSAVYSQINRIVNSLLITKTGVKTRIGIGRRTSGASRIAIMDADNDVQLYPSIFNMSSGELALLCLFGELVRQTDKLGKTAEKITGIVLIDEIDKHLHIRLQKEILPKLFELFPNVQFITSSHSPFLGLGLEEYKKISFRIIDLDNNGIICPIKNNTQFSEVYNLIVSQDEQFRDRYIQLKETIEKDNKPILITEGKTDWKHIKAAKEMLGINDIDIELLEYDYSLGDDSLKSALCNFAMIKNSRIIIGIFDRDKPDFWKELYTEKYISLNNNVYAFSIPSVNQEEYGNVISIEHYYKRSDLTRVDSLGRRIFLGDEFLESGFSKDGKYHSRCKNLVTKVINNGVIDDRVYEIQCDLEEKKSIALSKNDFADLILNKDSFADGIDFTNFNLIFEIIREIVNNHDQT